nr:hypothetical protein [uncultured Dongia sp.]
MNDDDFLRALEACTLAPAAFNHAAHLRAGFLYLQRQDFPEALGAMRRAIKAFAVSIGKDGLYHETITTAFMTLINARLAIEPAGGSWEDFAAHHRDLFDGTALSQHYSRERLQHKLARQIFLLPDRVPDAKDAA